MVETLIELGYVGLFIACFISATLVPFSSDVVVVAAVVAGLDHHACFIAATLGGWMGAMVNYYLGKLGKEDWIEKHSRVKPERFEKVKQWLLGKGAYMGLFAWVPVFGNVIIICLGYLRVNVIGVNIFVIIGMAIRYLVVILLTLGGMKIIS